VIEEVCTRGREGVQEGERERGSTGGREGVTLIQDVFSHITI